VRSGIWWWLLFFFNISLGAYILGPVGSFFLWVLWGFFWAASANLEWAGFALDWDYNYYYYLDWKGNGNKQQQNGQGWWCIYLLPHTKGEDEGWQLGSSWEEGAGWLDNLSPTDIFHVRPPAFHGLWDGMVDLYGGDAVRTVSIR
jgi:hypothetical protein